MPFIFRTLLVVIFLATCSCVALAQSTDNANSPFSKPSDNDDRPKGIQETLEKLRIEKDKKDHDEMVTRGEEAVKISTELQKSFTENGKLSDDDIVKLARVEKIVKKIREELGGGDGDDKADPDDTDLDPAGQKEETTGLHGEIDLLKIRSVTLYEELKKTTRFTISAAAIFSSNAVLKLAKTLRFGN